MAIAMYRNRRFVLFTESDSFLLPVQGTRGLRIGTINFYHGLLPIEVWSAAISESQFQVIPCWTGFHGDLAKIHATHRHFCSRKTSTAYSQDVETLSNIFQKMLQFFIVGVFVRFHSHIPTILASALADADVSFSLNVPLHCPVQP